MFGGKTKVEAGLRWYEFGRLTPGKLRTPLSITFAFVATHNHFVLDRGGKVFNRSAPVIKLPADATEDDHLALLGLLNSSVGCFWLKQVCQNRGSTVDDRGARQTTIPFEDFYEIGGGLLKGFAITQDKPLPLARKLDALARQRDASLPAALGKELPSILEGWAERQDRADLLLRQMISAQEELDWWCYSAYGLVDNGMLGGGIEKPPIRFGERAFEVLMARKIRDDAFATTWFQRHGAEPSPDLPSDWPATYADLVERRIEAIRTNHEIRLIEKPEFKRRWNVRSWEDQEMQVLREWLLDRLESHRIWSPGATLLSVGRIADRLREEPGAVEVAALYGGPDVNFVRLVGELLAGEAVPYLAARRYRDAGLRKRRAWEDVWDLQRREDRGEDVGDIPVPPKYASADFASSTTWRLRGKLDVPKERFIVYPGSERSGDPSPVYGWAGWTHLEQAKALAAFYLRMKEDEGWRSEQLAPLLAGILELEPWIHQWHDSDGGRSGLGAYFAAFVDDEARELGTTVESVRAWSPEPRGRGRKKRA